GLLEQDGKCVAPSECDCLHLYKSEGRKAASSMYIRPGDSILIGCNTCVCTDGLFRCTNDSCRGAVGLSEWSDWTGCTSCVPRSVLSQASGRVEHGQKPDPQDLAALPEVAQHLGKDERYRVCVVLESGQLVTADLCSGTLRQQRACVNITLCDDDCHWGSWGLWSPCREPCSGGFRIRQRSLRQPQDTGTCRGPKFQSESCNTAKCP
uniref:SCO-spondin-like n=1 Tax=Pristiophorus japonicus TaxID=55135 RepID=UPI00398EDA57